MKPVILFRADLDAEDEAATCAEYLPTVNFRTDVPNNSLVVGRYSCLPFYRELEQELASKQSKLINSYQQHQWIANLIDWGGQFGVLEGLTPKTWTDWSALPKGKSFVVKGRTNSRKQRWNTHMFAATRADVPVVAGRLLDDTLISEQGLVIREYVPLKKLGEGLNGLPVTNEWRLFFLKNQLLAKGFYWSRSHPELEPLAGFSSAAENLALEAADLVSQHTNFFVLDLAETKAGDWIVIEVNDGQQSGLCGVDAAELYLNLAATL